MMMQLLNPREFGLEKSKQMINDDEEDVWMIYFSSKQLESKEILKCHGRCKVPTATILQDPPRFFFNRCSIIPTDEDSSKNKAKAMVKFDEQSAKSLEEFERIWRFSVLDLRL